jgi:hypothetical protein
VRNYALSLRTHRTVTESSSRHANDIFENDLYKNFEEFPPILCTVRDLGEDSSGARRVFIRRASVRVTRLRINLNLVATRTVELPWIRRGGYADRVISWLVFLDRIWRFAASIAGSRCRWGLGGLTDDP